LLANTTTTTTLRFHMFQTTLKHQAVTLKLIKHIFFVVFSSCKLLMYSKYLGNTRNVFTFCFSDSVSIVPLKCRDVFRQPSYRRRDWIYIGRRQRKTTKTLRLSLWSGRIVVSSKGLKKELSSLWMPSLRQANILSREFEKSYPTPALHRNTDCLWRLSKKINIQTLFSRAS
jgi:hypothetical protein